MSIAAKIIFFFLGLANAKKVVEKSFLNPKRSTKPLVPKYLFKIFYVSDFQISNKSVVTLQPKTGTTNTHVLYFHGGAYLLEGNSMHWKMVETIATNANCRVSYIDYLLAPEHNNRATFDMVQQSYDRLIIEYPNDRFCLMGDSAGGGLALAFAQKLLKENAAIQPVKNILFSPWLDLALQNPEIRKQESLDKLLPLNGLIEAGRKYAGGDDQNNYLVSPINGNLESIGETIVFYGTDELFYPDCQKLRAKTAGFGNFSFHEFPGMQHDWVIFPIPEASEALNLAIDFIRD